jgi:hypothetical protein
MKLFIGNDCSSDKIFILLDPTAFSEPEFEFHVIQALTCAYPEYHCIPFRASFSFENQIRKADLALVHNSFSHWFVVEVELVSHSLMGHVVPQVRCFRFGEPVSECAQILCDGIDQMNYSHALTFLQFIPRSIVVVANRRDAAWKSCLRGLDVQMITLSVFKRSDGQIAHEIDGELLVISENLGFFRYSAIDRSLRLPPTLSDVAERVQIEDPFGGLGCWLVTRTEEAVWLTKESGDPGLPHNEMLQILRSNKGILKLSLTSLR